MDESGDSFNAFLEDDEESLDLRGGRGGGGGRGGRGQGGGYSGYGGGRGNLGASGALGMSGSLRGSSELVTYASGGGYGGGGGGYGGGGGTSGFRYGGGGGGGDPYCIDLSAAGARQQHQVGRGGPGGAGVQQPRPKRAGSSSDVPPMPLAAERRSSPPVGMTDRPSAKSSRQPAFTRESSTSSDATEQQSTPGGAAAGGGVASMFASFQKEMAAMKESAEEMRRKQSAEEKKKKEDQEERARKEEERKKEEEERKKREKEEEAQRKKAEEEERKRKEQEEKDEAERKKKEAAEEKERQKREEQEAERRRKEQEAEDERQRKAKEEEEKKKSQEEAELKRRGAEEEAKTKADEEERQQRLKEIHETQEADRKRYAEEAAPPTKDAEVSGVSPEEAAARKQKEEEDRRQAELKRLYDEQQKKKLEEAELQKKQDELKKLHDEQQQKQSEDAEERRRQEELKKLHEEQQSAKAAEDERLKKQEDLKKIHEENMRKKAEEEERQRKQDELKRLHEINIKEKADEEERLRKQEELRQLHEERMRPIASAPAATSVPGRSRSPSPSPRDDPLMASVVHGPVGGVGSFANAGGGGLAALRRREEAQAPPRRPQAAFDDDRFRLECTDGMNLFLQTTDSAEELEKRAYWQARAAGGLVSSQTLGREGGRTFSGATGLLEELQKGAGTLSPELLRAELEAVTATASQMGSLADGAGLLRMARAERGQLDKLQAELQALQVKITLLEKYNCDLAAAKASAEASTVQLDSELVKVRMESKRLADELTAGAAKLKEKDMAFRDLEKRLESSQGEVARQAMQDAADVARAIAEREKLAEQVSRLEAELAGVREERDTFREDLEAAANAPGGASGARAALRELAERHLGDGADRDDASLRLRAELATAESMLRHCEKENENLVQQNRQLRQAAKLKREEVDGRQLQLVAELNAAKASADTNPASMRRVSELERELVLARERAEEASRELERCRETKRQLERELLHGPAATAAEPIQEFTVLKQQLADTVADKGKLETKVSELQDKVVWYAESQREMDEDRREIERLNEELHGLRAENRELRRRPTPNESGKRVADLRKQVEDLQECLRRRHPDSLLALVKACEPPPEEKRELRELRAKVEELEGKLSERDAMYDRRVRSLRAQYDTLRYEYQRRTEGALGSPAAADGESPGGGGVSAAAARACPDREAVLAARIQDLEKQVEATKRYYLTKLRNREPLVPPKPARTPSQGGGHREAAELQLALRERDHRIDELSRAVRLLEEHHEPSASSTALPPGHCAAAAGAARASEVPSASAPDEPWSSPALLRLFLASPEAQALASLSGELRAMGRSARCHRFDEVASAARSLATVLGAEEAAAASHHEATFGVSMAGYGGGGGVGQDALRLQAQPPLPKAVWSAWRTLAGQLAAVAAEASLRGGGGIGEEPPAAADVAVALSALRTCVEGVLRGLVFAQHRGHRGGAPAPREAWASGAGVGAGASGAESLLPRLLLERLGEEIDLAGASHAGALLQDAEVHAGLDHKLPWAEFAGVLRRSGLGGAQLLAECQAAAPPDWSLSLWELQALLLGGGGGGGCSLAAAVAEAVPTGPSTGLVRTLTRIRLAAARHEPPLPALFFGLDADGRGFLPRGAFVEALGRLGCALSREECDRLATFFSPASDPRWVCYPLLLQSVVPTRGEASACRTPAATTAADDGACNGSGSLPAQPVRWAQPFEGRGLARSLQAPSTGGLVGSAASAERLAALARAAEVEADNEDLRQQLRMLEARCAEASELVARSPAQAVQRLQGEVAALERRVLEQQTGALTAARKAEITLRSELEISQHEASVLRRTIEAKDRELLRYKRELEEIIAELAELQAAGSEGQ